MFFCERSKRQTTRREIEDTSFHPIDDCNKFIDIKTKIGQKNILHCIRLEFCLHFFSSSSAFLDFRIPHGFRILPSSFRDFRLCSLTPSFDNLKKIFFLRYLTNNICSKGAYGMPKSRKSKGEKALLYGRGEEMGNVERRRMRRRRRRGQRRGKESETRVWRPEGSWQKS